MPAPKITDDHRKLVYLVGIYANALDKSADKENWFKDGPLYAAIYELTAEGVFEKYDYCPVSVLGLDGFHRFMNISVEGKDDLDDLRELGHEPWLDEWEIKVGDCIVTKIEEGMSNSDYVVFR